MKWTSIFTRNTLRNRCVITPYVALVINRLLFWHVLKKNFEKKINPPTGGVGGGYNNKWLGGLTVIFDGGEVAGEKGIILLQRSTE